MVGAVLCIAGCSSIPGLYPLDASGIITPPSCDNQQCPQTLPHPPLDGQNRPLLRTMALDKRNSQEAPHTTHLLTGDWLLILYLIISVPMSQRDDTSGHRMEEGK